MNQGIKTVWKYWKSDELTSVCDPGGSKDVQSIISDYFGDQDPRVRTAAIKAMVGHQEPGLLHGTQCQNKV